MSDDNSGTCLLTTESFDTHVHVFEPKLGPYASGRSYTPEDATLGQLVAFNRGLTEGARTSALVLVQPSPYRTDCRVMLACLRELQQRRVESYAIAVLDLEDVTDEELAEMHQLGTRGIRLNFQSDSQEVDLSMLVARLHQAARRIRHLSGWIIQVFVPGWVWSYIHQEVLELPVRIIADHLGGVLGCSKLSRQFVEAPLTQPGLQPLLALAKQGQVFVKISGLYRASNQSNSNFSDMQPIIGSFAREIPDQLIWGSDWPHTGDGHNRVNRVSKAKEPFRLVDDMGILRNLRDWVGGDVWLKMMQSNPRRYMYPVQAIRFLGWPRNILDELKKKENMLFSTAMIWFIGAVRQLAGPQKNCPEKVPETKA